MSKLVAYFPNKSLILLEIYLLITFNLFNMLLKIIHARILGCVWIKNVKAHNNSLKMCNPSPSFWKVLIFVEVTLSGREAFSCDRQM